MYFTITIRYLLLLTITLRNYSLWLFTYCFHCFMYFTNCVLSVGN